MIASKSDVEQLSLPQRWRALQTMHGRIETHITRALEPAHDLSVRELTLLDALSRQREGDGGHLQMKELADVVALSQSATTRLVTRLEARGLLTRYICPTDRRGIYTDVTDAGAALLEQARSTHDDALVEALSMCEDDPAFGPWARALRGH